MYRLLVFFGVSATLWLLYFFAVSRTYPDLQQRGLFGDSFGAFSALFTGLALAGTAYAIYRQDEQSRDHERKLNEQMKLQQRTALALERNSAVELVALIKGMDSDNAKALTAYLNFIKSHSTRPDSAAAVSQAAESAKNHVMVQRLLMDAHNRSLESLFNVWDLPDELAKAYASLGKPHDQKVWEEMIDKLTTQTTSNSPDAS